MGLYPQQGENGCPRLWPTPLARDWKGPTGKAEWNSVPDAVRAVRYLWPTPQASDNRDRGNLSTPAIQRRIRLGKQANLSMVVSHENGRLNPTWVEWLMGFPEGWTDCGR